MRCKWRQEIHADKNADRHLSSRATDKTKSFSSDNSTRNHRVKSLMKHSQETSSAYLVGMKTKIEKITKTTTINTTTTTITMTTTTTKQNFIETDTETVVGKSSLEEMMERWNVERRWMNEWNVPTDIFGGGRKRRVLVR